MMFVSIPALRWRVNHNIGWFLITFERMRVGTHYTDVV